MEQMQSENYSYKHLSSNRIEDIIENDHKEIESKLSSLISESGLSVNDRRNLYNDIKHEVLDHMMAEEESFYPHIESIEGVKRGQMLESKEEHHQIRTLLDELDDVAVEDEHWCAKLRVLCEDLKHHHREEEEEFLSKTKDAWDDKKSEDIGNEFVKAKMRANQ